MKSNHANMSSEQTLKEVEAARVCMRTKHANTKEQRKDFQVDFSTTKMTEQHHFDTFEQNAETAVMLWHMNSGFNRFSGLEDLKRRRRSKEAMSDLIDERDYEMHDPDEIIAIAVKAFTQIQGTGGY
jgi:ATP-dependent protease HslVU (ClpYQ) ATPase subunit